MKFAESQDSKVCAGLPPTTATSNLTGPTLARVRFIDASQRMELFYVRFLVCRCSMADPNAPGKCTKLTVGSPFFFSSKLFCTCLHVFFALEKSQLLPPGVFKCLCQEWMLLQANKVFSLYSRRISKSKCLKLQC